MLMAFGTLRGHIKESGKQKKNDIKCEVTVINIIITILIDKERKVDELVTVRYGYLID